jgi:hypothetical protein
MDTSIVLTVTVRPGQWVRDLEMPHYLPGVTAAVTGAVQDIARSVYPELEFSGVTWSFNQEQEEGETA